nr:TPR repeat protein [uncultured bacterium]
MNIGEWLRQGLAHLEQGELEQAAARFDAVLQMVPDEPEVLLLAAMVAEQRGNFSQALSWLGRGLVRSPGDPRLHLKMGVVLKALKRVEPARERFLEAAELNPEDCEPHLQLGLLAQESGDDRGAVAHYQRALALAPDLPEAHFNLGCAWQSLGENASAESCFEQVLLVKKEHERAHYNLGIIRQGDGRNGQAVEDFATACRIRPGYAKARWKMLLDLPVLIEEEEQIEPLRERWRNGVLELMEAPLDTPEQIRESFEAASAVSHFYLNYHGQNDLEEQRLYGGLVTRTARAVFPQYADPVQRAIGARLKVGFISSFFYGHSIFKTHSRWITELDSSLFERFVYHTGGKEDGNSHYLRDRAEHYRWLPPSVPVADLIEILVADSLDVLIYTDLGMDGRLHPVAALNLAPVQCNGGGHPVTSGLDSIGYFLSSDLMEPKDAQGHYTEWLIRLPHLASCYPKPRVELARQPSGFESGRVNFVNLQSLFKLLPQHDELFSRIAAEVIGSRFFFIGISEAVNGMFMARLNRAFGRYGLDAGEYCRILPRMPQEEFFGLARCADVILDGIAWSGNNSSLEALAFDVPIVTLPGEMFRARHTYGILRRMGVEESIAFTPEQFVEKGVRLAEESAERRELSLRIRESKGVLYEDPEVPEALGHWLQSLTVA